MSRIVAACLTFLVVCGMAVVPAAAAPGSAPVYDHDGETEPIDCSYPITETDVTGTEVTIGEEPERVVVLGPSTAQTMWEIGARDKVVGMPVNFFTSYLEGSGSKTHVVDNRGQPITEAVVGTEPDLVIAPNITSPQAVRSLRDAGLTVFTFELAGSLDDVNGKTRTIGRLTGEFGNATQVSANTHARIEAVRNAVADADRPVAYYALGDGFTAGPETFIGDVIDSAGAENIASEAGIPRYDVISQEVLAANTIDWLVLPGQAPRPMNPAINESRAVAQGNIVRVDNNYINQPGPRVIQPLATMAESFHPEAMANVDLGSIEAEPSVRCASSVERNGETTTADGMDSEETTAEGGVNDEETTAMADDGMATTTATDGMAGEDMATTTADDGTENGSGPGFTAVVALVAVIATALIAARRS